MKWSVLVAALAAAVVATAAGAAPVARDVDAYRGIGAWIDIYDGSAWKDPEGAVASLQAHGVTTLYLETSNYRKSADLVDRAVIGRFVEAAHEAGLSIVAWYLPSFVNLGRDFRRSLAAIDFQSANGEHFDSFGLDIEASVVKPVSKRTTRTVILSRRIRSAVGDDYPLGAIIPAPRGMDLNPTYWPGFPYRELADSFDVFLPMGYFTYRSGTISARTYTRDNVNLIRERTEDPEMPVHAVGGLASRATTAEVKRFVTGATEAGALGVSLYDFLSMKPAQWRPLGAFVAP